MQFHDVPPPPTTTTKRKCLHGKPYTSFSKSGKYLFVISLISLKLIVLFCLSRYVW